MAEKEVIVVASRVKEAISSSDMQMAGDFVQALSETTYNRIQSAIERAKANGRKTVRPEDI